MAKKETLNVCALGKCRKVSSFSLISFISLKETMIKL